MGASPGKKTFMRADFAVSSAVRAWAKKNAMPDPYAHLGEFVDYWLSVGKPMANWDATFRNRLRMIKARQQERAPQRRPRPDAREILRRQEQS